jgi:hypothetical protein
VKLFIARSVTLEAKADALADRLKAAGHEVTMPCNPEGLTEVRIFKLNAERIRRADVVLALWSGVSDGCPMDCAMAIALGKPVYVQGIYEWPEEGLTCAGAAGPRLPRAWALFSELSSIDSWWKEQA